MPKAFQEWTVLPHGPLEKLSQNLWCVEGTMPNGQNKRTMSLIKLADGRLIIHNAIALRDEVMPELTAFGTPAAILVPNGFHRMDAKIMKDRFPSAKVYCPGAAKKRVAEVVAVDGSYADAPHDEIVKVRHLDGVSEKEGVVEVNAPDGRSLIFCDTLLNMAGAPHVFKLLLAPVGRLSVPRFSRWFFVKNKQALRSDFERMAASGVRNIVPGHGARITDGATEALRSAASLLA